MKRRITISALAILLLFAFSGRNTLNAQIFDVGDNDLNIQVGFGAYNVWFGTYVESTIPTFSVSLDHGLRDDWGPGVFSIGGYVSACGYEARHTAINGDEYGYKYFSTLLAIRATYHYQFVDKLDTYGGALTGVIIRADKYYGRDIYEDNYSADGTFGAAIAGFVGVKYYLTSNFSFMSELYIGHVFFNIGIGLKL